MSTSDGDGYRVRIRVTTYESFTSLVLLERCGYTPERDSFNGSAYEWTLWHFCWDPTECLNSLQSRGLVQEWSFV